MTCRPVPLEQVSTSSRLVVSSTITPANAGYSFNMSWSLSSGSLAVSVRSPITRPRRSCEGLRRCMLHGPSHHQGLPWPSVAGWQSLSTAASTSLTATSTASSYKFILVLKVSTTPCSTCQCGLVGTC